MNELFQPFESRNLKVKNRLVRSATWENLATPEGGICANSYGLYEELAAGGVGAIITGFTSVDAHDRYFGGTMRLCDDALIPEYKKLVDTIHGHDVRVLTQLALGSYYAPGPDGRYREVEIDAMSEEEIVRIIRLFVAAGSRAARAGFDGVQIHAAHFFFLSRFISPAVNHRTDGYGGSVAARAQAVVEILRGIRREAPGLHISVKLNSSDFLTGGLTEADALETGRLLAENGIDSIEVSGNGTSRTGIRGPNDEAYFGMFAMRLAEVVDVPVILVGGPALQKGHGAPAAQFRHRPAFPFAAAHPPARSPPPLCQRPDGKGRLHLLQRLLQDRRAHLRVYPDPEMTMRKLIKAQTRRGVQLDGVVFGEDGEETVLIAITGIHGNFYSNPMYYNIGDTLSENGIAFIYAQTNDAFNRMETINTRTGATEVIGSYNECFDDICDDISAYVRAAQRAGYRNILLAGHSLGANKVIHYLANAKETPVRHFILVSPANMKFMLANVTEEERTIIRAYVEQGRGNELLPFPFMGWAPMIAATAWQWLWKNPLDNVHSDEDGDFSEVARIRQTGALVIGTYDRFSFGEPRAFIELINAHTCHPAQNEVIFVEGTGHIYSQREQALADILLRLARKWQAEARERKG